MKTVTALFSLLLLMSGTARADDMHAALGNYCLTHACVVSGLTREVVTGNIAHYSATIKVGSGEHDIIGVHRVVAEISPWNTKHLTKALFLVHGDNLNFNASFFVGTVNGSHDSSAATWFAQHNLDVWGIDLRWAKVPATVTDYNFMATWNLETDVHDTQKAVLIARAVRALTGSTANKLKLLGYSRGGQLGYVYAGLDAQLPNALRSVDGYIPVDTLIKTDDSVVQANLCGAAAGAQAAIDAGQYGNTAAQTIIGAGQLAEADPSGPSPIIPGLTNEQLGLVFGAQTYQFAPYTPTYHVIGANFIDTHPVSFRWTQELSFFRTMQAASPVESWGANLQGDQVICTDTPLDDHLHDITIPIFGLGGRGGLGDEGLYSTTLVSSADVTYTNISITTGKAEDFGHDDLWRASNAAALVWSPILNFVTTH